MNDELTEAINKLKLTAKGRTKRLVDALEWSLRNDDMIELCYPYVGDTIRPKRRNVLRILNGKEPIL